jgi:hypothetical protein
MSTGVWKHGRKRRNKCWKYESVPLMYVGSESLVPFASDLRIMIVIRRQAEWLVGLR